MKVLVTGGHGFLGSRVVDLLNKNTEYDVKVFRSSEYNLVNQLSCYHLVSEYKPHVVIHLAASVGGIGANMREPGRFFYDNILMGTNLIHSCMIENVKKFIMVGTVCSYPKFCNVPFVESDLWNGYPEETNAPYGIAKKSLYVMLDAYKKQYNFNSTVLIPCNLYGPRDNFDDSSSHVIPALIKKFVRAKRYNHDSVTIWGDGSATREFLYVDDAAEAIVKSINYADGELLNLGGGLEISISDLVGQISSIIGYGGQVLWDTTKPNGQPRRFLNCDLAKKSLDWEPKESFTNGLEKTIRWYEENNKGDL